MSPRTKLAQVGEALLRWAIPRIFPAVRFLRSPAAPDYRPLGEEGER